MGKGLVELYWCHGNVASCWFETAPAQIPCTPSYSSHATLAAGEVAALVEERKIAKYSGLPVIHSLTPVAIETSGVIGPKSLQFLKELRRGVRQQIGEEKANS